VAYFLGSLALIGLAALAVAIVGALMPPGTRLEVLLSLLAGAGAGIVAFAGGLLGGLDALSSSVLTRLFFAATCLGAVVTAIVLATVWLRRRARTTDLLDDQRTEAVGAVTGVRRPAARSASSVRASGAVRPGHPPARRRGARVLAG
jgi:hypothetical protein